MRALPLRLRTEVIGVLNLFSTDTGPLRDDDAGLGQALADVATIGLLQHRAIEDRQVLAEPLRGALNSRVLVEQAKGVLAERLQVGMPERSRPCEPISRRHNQRISDLAQGIIDGSVDTTRLVPP